MRFPTRRNWTSNDWVGAQNYQSPYHTAFQCFSVLICRCGIPKHPAYIPERQAGLTDDMSLPQRVKNTFLYFLHDAARRIALWKFEELQRRYNLSPEKSMPEMLAGAQLWLFYGDFALDFARPLQPNVVLVPSPMLGLPLDDKVRAKFGASDRSGRGLALVLKLLISMSPCLDSCQSLYVWPRAI